MKKKGKKIKVILILVLSIIAFLASYLLFTLSLDNRLQYKVNYKENNDIDYKVYLKANNFFEETYLGKDNIYITSLIDYLDVNFLQNIKFDQKITGSYVYYVKAIVSASSVNNADGNYWKKEYLISEKEKVDYKDTDEIVFNKDLKIDYQKYNDVLLEFKKEYNLALDGTLRIVLCIENNIDNVFNKDNQLSKSSISILQIPLTKATIEVPIEITTDKKTGVLTSEVIYKDDIIYLLYKIFAAVVFVLGVILLLYVVLILVKKGEKESKYAKEIRKILKTYDSIIVNSIDSLNEDLFNIIDVDNFNELIDAHGEVRQPINYIRHKTYSEFILINDKMAWRYKIVKDKV